MEHQRLDHRPPERVAEGASVSSLDSSSRSQTPQAGDTARGRTPTSTHNSSLKSRRKAQLLAAQRKARRRRWMILGLVLGAITLVGLGLGLGLGLTLGRRRAADAQATAFYNPPTIAHTTPENDLMAQMFEYNIPKNATHWDRLNQQLENWKILGIKNVWLPPAMKNADRQQIGYDVYDLWDLGEFHQQGAEATVMGTKSQLMSLVKAASKAGIGLIFDAVFNQKSGADQKVACQAHGVNSTNRLQQTTDTKTIEAYVQFDFKARGGKYSSKTFGCDDFTAVSYDASSDDDTTIWKIEGTTNDFETDVSDEMGNYDYLLLNDLAYANPSVRADALAWIKWLAEQVNPFGIRLDAGKHLSRGFVKDVLDTLRAYNSGQDMWFAVEYMDQDSQALEDYLDALDNRVKLFDTGLLWNFRAYADGNATDLSQYKNNTIIGQRPDQAVTFVVTHDTQPGQATDILYVDGWFLGLAYAIVLLRNEGLPCLFYGNIYGTYNDDVSVFTPDPKRQLIANMAVARRYWMYGQQTDYFDDKHTIGWTHTGVPDDRPDGMAVVISNNPAGSTKTMNVGAQHAGETWTDITTNIIGHSVVIDASGHGDFPVRGQSVSVWVNEHAKEGRDSLSKFDGDIYGLSPYSIGQFSTNFVGGGGGSKFV